MQQKSLSQTIHVDFLLFIGLLVVSILGLFVIYSASGQNDQIIYKQAIRLLVGFCIMVAVAQLPASLFKRWAPALYTVGLILLIAVLLVGITGKGAQRWLNLGIITFQPSEIMKISVPLVIAWFLSERSLPPTLISILQSLLIIAVPVLLIAKQPDLGTALLVGVAGLTVVFIAGVNWRYLLAFFLMLAPSCYVLWRMMHEYQRQRVMTFINPEHDPLGAGYHIIQSKIAIGSGGIYGKGWLNGTQSHLEFLPERSTDFIFAVFCEEFGFLGVLFLYSIYTLIILRGMVIALNATETFSKLFAGGIILTFFVYVFVNTGMVSGQLPVVGVPLPLISYGGSSMVTIMIGFGILMSIETHKRFLS